MEACRAATDLVVEQNATNGAHVSWVNGGAALNQADDFTVAWSTNINEDLSAAEHVINVTDATETDVTGLPYNSTVYFWVKHNCSDLSLSSSWLGPDSVKTSVAMPKVDSLTAVPTHSTIAATWKRNEAEFATENQWKVALKDMTNQDATVWSLIDHTDTLFYGLPNAHAFMVGVIAVNGTNESDTTWKMVSTTALPDPCAQIGEGTATATLLKTNYGNTYSQHIYTAAELTAMGYSAGKITSLSFNYTGTSSSYDKTQSVYIGTTTLDAFSDHTASDFVTGLTLSYGPTLNSYESGWREYELSTPFVWDGTSNIVVGMLSNSTQSTASGWDAQGTSVSANRTIFHYKDNTPIDVDNLSATMNSYNHGSSNTRPNVKFCFERTGTCLKPTHVVASDVTTNSATLSWMPGNSETAWQYAYSDSVMSDLIEI